MSLLPTSAFYGVFCHLLLNLILSNRVSALRSNRISAPFSLLVLSARQRAALAHVLWPLQDSDPF